jgi:hypothetical protein
MLKPFLRNEPIFPLLEAGRWKMEALLPNEPIWVRKRGLVRSGDSQVVPVPAFEPRNPVAKFQNEPNLERILNLINLQSTISNIQFTKRTQS